MKETTKPKFTFMPVRKAGGPPPAPTLGVTITRAGIMLINDRAVSHLGITGDVVVIQVLADYDRRVVGFKLMTTITPSTTGTDTSIRFIKPTRIKLSGTMTLCMAIQRVLLTMGHDYKKIGPVRLELQKYTDSWTKDVWYVQLPKSNTVHPQTPVDRVDV